MRVSFSFRDDEGLFAGARYVEFGRQLYRSTIKGKGKVDPVFN